MSKTHVIIVAAGSGSRFGGPLPKQFCDLAGLPVLIHTVNAFRAALPAAEITLVLSAHGREIWDSLCKKHGYRSPRTIIGGATRYESVCNAITAVSPDSDFVMVHDGARPFPPINILKNYATLLADGKSCGLIPVVSVTDSLRKIDGNASSAVDRSSFRAVQTPQIFRTQDFIAAYRAAKGKDESLFTDDASVIDSNGGALMLADGSPRNIKITNPGDLALAEFYLAHPE